MGNPSNMSLAQILETGFKTLDGRITTASFYTPGGDAGEFILALQVFQDLHAQDAEDGQPLFLSYAQVKEYLVSYLNYMSQPTFYMATDDQSVAHIKKQLGVAELDVAEQPKDEKLKVDLLLALIQPDNVGDLHIRYLLQDSQQYSVDHTLVEFFIQAYYETLWEDLGYATRLNLDILSGKHEEQAFVEITTAMVIIQILSSFKLLVLLESQSCSARLRADCRRPANIWKPH